MAYDTQLAQRVRKAASHYRGIKERSMFGSLIFIKQERMAIGIYKDKLMVKVPKADQPQLIKKAHVEPVRFSNATMGGFVFVTPRGYASAAALAGWVKRGFATADAIGPKTEKEKAAAKKNKFTVGSLKEVEEIIKLAQPEMRPVAQALRNVIKGEGFPFLEKASLGRRAITYRHEKAGYVLGIFPLKGRVRLVFEHGAKLKDPRHILQSDEGHLRQIRYVEFHDVTEVEKMAPAIGDLIRLALKLKQKPS